MFHNVKVLMVTFHFPDGCCYAFIMADVLVVVVVDNVTTDRKLTNSRTKAIATAVSVRRFTNFILFQNILL